MCIRDRIDINLLLTINSQPASDRFEGSLQVIYARPIYGTDYNSPIIDLVDQNVQFNFLENTQVEFTPDRFLNNLSSILGYYAYFILGVDADTFSPMGGAQFYTLAQQVVNLAQSTNESGWKAFEDQRNRYWLLDNQVQAVFPLLARGMPRLQHLWQQAGGALDRAGHQVREVQHALSLIHI